MAIYSNLTIDQGSSFKAVIDVTDSDGNPLNLDGFTIAGQLRKNYNSTTAVDFSTAVTNATEGTMQITLTATQTNNLKAGRYVYDVEITSGNEVTRVIEGQIEVNPGVTRA